jgi:thymidylate kinase
MLIVFIGADGSGKTSVANELAKRLVSKFKSVDCYHTIFGIIPKNTLNTLNVFSFKKNRKELVEINTRQKDGFYDYPEPYSATRASMILMKNSIDYFLGHILANPFTRKKNLLIFDRYFYEFFTEEHFKNQPKWTLSLYKFILPKPDLVIYLHNEPEVIFNRKPEQSIDQIRINNERNESIINELSYSIRIKTDSSIAEIASKVEARILEKI